MRETNIFTHVLRLRREHRAKYNEWPAVIHMTGTDYAAYKELVLGLPGQIFTLNITMIDADETKVLSADPEVLHKQMIEEALQHNKQKE